MALSFTHAQGHTCGVQGQVRPRARVCGRESGCRAGGTRGTELHAQGRPTHAVCKSARERTCRVRTGERVSEPGG